MTVMKKKKRKKHGCNNITLYLRRVRAFSELYGIGKGERKIITPRFPTRRSLSDDIFPTAVSATGSTTLVLPKVTRLSGPHANAHTLRCT